MLEFMRANDQISDQYEVSVNGRRCDVHAARVSALPFNCVWPGRQRPAEQSELSSFVRVISDEKLTFRVKVKVKSDFESAVIRPLSAGVTCRREGAEIAFEIDRAGSYVLEADGEHFALHIFVDEPCDFGGKSDYTYWFGPGVHRPGVIRLRDGDSVYIDKDAVVYGSVYGNNVRNATVRGYGILDGGYEERTQCQCYEDRTIGCIKFYESQNIRLEGIVVRDSAVWVTSIFASENVAIEGIRIVGQWRYNTDGIDIVNSKNVLIRNCFVRAFDDAIVIKGVQKFKDKNVSDISVVGCVLWCGWGRTCEIGLETVCERYDRILFSDLDLIHNSAVCLDIQNGDYAVIRDVRFENIRAEYQAATLPEVYQQSMDMTYPENPGTGVPILINIDNHKYVLDGFEEEYEPTKEFGRVEGVRYKDIRVFSEPGVPLPPLRFRCFGGEGFADVRIDGLFVDGKRLKREDADCSADDRTEAYLDGVRL